MTGVGSRKRRPGPLEKDGPVVSRARASLLAVARELGTIRQHGPSGVEVTTPDGLGLTLTYAYGNYLFSRVYNLEIAMDLPADAGVPAGLELSYRGAGPHFRSTSRGTGGPGPAGVPSTRSGTARLNALLGDRLSHIDVLHARTTMHEGTSRFRLTPMGGAFVWVLLPPVFKTIAFPSGEIARILDVFRQLRNLSPSSSAASGPRTSDSPTKG